MNISSLIGKKVEQTQGFLEDGTRVPLSVIAMNSNIVSAVKTTEKDGYNALKMGFGIKNKPNKPEAGFIKKAGLEKAPRFFCEVKTDETGIEVGTKVGASEVFEPGDIVDVMGTSKGKGYAGAVKRYHFKGGPKTHGQSDRHRAPGSSGSGTTPGRVYKGKRMSGRMGNEQVTIKNLEVLSVDEESMCIKGLVPGPKGSIIVVKKVGKNKKFMPLYSSKIEEEKIELVEEEKLVKELDEAEKVEELKTEEVVEASADKEVQEESVKEDSGKEDVKVSDVEVKEENENAN